MPTFPSPHGAPAPRKAYVDYPEVPATAMGGLKAPFVLGWVTGSVMCPSLADRSACTASAAGRRQSRRGLHAGHGRRDGAADEAIEPVVVGLGGLGVPLVDRPPVAFGDDVGFGIHHVLGKKPVLLGLVPEERQRAVVAGDGGKGGVDEGLP